MSETRSDPVRLSRRGFVRFAAASAASGVLAACEQDTLVPEGPDLARGGIPGGGGGGASSRNPLYMPNTVSPSSLTLTAAPTDLDLGGGRISRVWAYNSSFPGPTLLANRGDVISGLSLQNRLSQESITHWHGMIVPQASDGHPMHAIGPGASYPYPTFSINQRATLNWYHPHPHMLAGEQVAMGLAGAFIVRDSEEAALGLPSGAYEVPLIIRDASFDKAGNMQYKPRSGGFEGNTPLVNGTRDPYLNVNRAVYRLRLLNGSNARIYRLALSDGGPFTLIGNDGGLLATAISVTEITLSPAERADLLVDLSGLASGATLMLRDLDAGWDLLEFRGTGQGSAGGITVSSLSSITPLVAPVVTREFSFDGMSKINGREYALDRIDFTVPLGQTERWIFTTRGNAPHPVHVHAAYFQVQRRTGGRGQIFPWERGWKDTVLLEDGETVEVWIRFDQHPGVFLLHCHKLEHEDMGMMSNFLVTAPAT